MNSHLLPQLPPPFVGSAVNIADENACGEYLPIPELVERGFVEKGIDGLLERWGPGDYRAAVSLWSQGYFSRLFRPLIAYGVIHDIWFHADLETAAAALSDISVPVRFRLSRALPNAPDFHIAAWVSHHMTPLIGKVSALTGTSERIHWSNASFALRTAVSQCTGCFSADMVLSQQRLDRLTAVERAIELNANVSRLTSVASEVSGGHVVRRVCCMRYNLARLDVCPNACPMRDAAPQKRVRQKD